MVQVVPPELKSWCLSRVMPELRDTLEMMDDGEEEVWISRGAQSARDLILSLRSSVQDEEISTQLTDCMLELEGVQSIDDRGSLHGVMLSLGAIFDFPVQ
jgi:hypothetical protein